MGLDVIFAGNGHPSSGAAFEGQATVYADKFGNRKTHRRQSGSLYNLDVPSISGQLTSKFDDTTYYTT